MVEGWEKGVRKGVREREGGRKGMCERERGKRRMVGGWWRRHNEFILLIQIVLIF